MHPHVFGVCFAGGERQRCTRCGWKRLFLFTGSSLFPKGIDDLLRLNDGRWGNVCRGGGGRLGGWSGSSGHQSVRRRRRGDALPLGRLRRGAALPLVRLRRGGTAIWRWRNRTLIVIACCIPRRPIVFSHLTIKPVLLTDRFNVASPLGADNLVNTRLTFLSLRRRE